LTALRLDIVSPLPPVRSGISDYTVDLLPGLAARADVRLIHLPDQLVDPAVAAAWPSAPFEDTAAGGRLPLYQMGNNRYHAGVLRLARERPGVLTLHDLVLHHLLLDRTLGHRDFPTYREELTRDHGWIGEAAALAKVWNAWGDTPVFALPAHRSLLLGQRGVLVHSRWAAEVIAEEVPAARVRAVPMGIPLPPAVEPEAGRALRRRFGLPEDAPVLGSFGFQTPIKRTETAIRALARSGLERVHLLVVGEAAPVLDLEGEARRAGVAGRVHVTGFVPFEDFGAAISAVDLCLNLRYPTAGETSASLLRVLAAGRPAVVSDYAQFADLPAAVAVRAPLGGDPDEEAEALAAALRGLLAEPARLRAMGEAAREHVRREHDPSAAAEAVIAACREWEHLPPPASAASTATPEPPTTLTWHQFAGTIEVQGAELPWPPGERRELAVRLTNRGFARWLAGGRGPGGLAVVVKLFEGRQSREDLLGGRAWVPLPRDLAPGEEATLRVEVRRPPGPAYLVIEPHTFGGLSFSFLEGPWWEADL
jgi:glycosyltransferase involved in cell wall biosynthesis